MFSIRRAYYDLLARLDTARATVDAERWRIASVERVFGTNIAALRNQFSDRNIELNRLLTRSDHRIADLEDVGVHALFYSRAIERHDLDACMGIVRQGRRESAPNRFVRETSEGVDLTVFPSVEVWFGGYQINLLTNDVDALHQIDAAEFSPPPPWVAFPNFEPPSVLLQGEQQFWFENVWDAFFQPLTREERAAYLAAHDAPAEWVEDLNYRAMGPTDDPEPG